MPLGRRGELATARVLLTRGWRLLGHSVRTRLGEIDLVAYRGGVLAAVEVKTRTWHPAPERCVAPTQLHRVACALRSLAPSMRVRVASLRVDVAAVRPLNLPTAPPTSRPDVAAPPIPPALEVVLIEGAVPGWRPSGH